MTIKVFFSSNCSDILKNINWLTPGKKGIWKDIQRVDDFKDADWLVILEDPSGDDPSGVIQKALEENKEMVAFPLTLNLKKVYMKFHFKNRFSWASKGGRVVCSLPDNYDILSSTVRVDKAKGLSCVVYQSTPKHILTWLSTLAQKRAFDVYGYDCGIGGLSTYKGPGNRVKEYLPYQMTITLEDTSRKNYFTERLTDPLVLWCKALYWGCTNLNEIFQSPSSGVFNLQFNEKVFKYLLQQTTKDNSPNPDFSLDKSFGDLRFEVLNKLNVWERIFKLKGKEILTKDSLVSRPEKVFPDPNVARDGICLIMIVRDESHVIERALESVVNVISSYLICDTGSLDNTPDIIETYMEKHNIPGQVIFKEWKNFGFNKSYLIKRAYEDNLSLGAKYLIWLDADEVFQNQRGESLDKNDGKELLDFANTRPGFGVFMFTTRYGGIEYPRWNMVRNNQLYVWECPVHEWLRPTVQTGTVLYDNVFVWARKEGARTRAGDSGRKDTKMFEQHLKEKPNCSRCHFYLGQTLGENGQLEEAIEMYSKRLEMPGFDQECYIASMRMGHFYLKLNKLDKALEIWDKGWKISKSRLEIPYYHMMALLRNKRMKEAYDIGTRGYENFRFSSTYLFIEKQIYDWRFFLEYSVVAYYSNHFQRAYDLGKRLLDEGKYPDIQATVIEKNMGIFKQKISKIKEVPLYITKKFNMHPPMIIVVDNFLADPDKVREFALSQEFTIKGNYPGQRTKPFATLEHKEAFERILGAEITFWPTGVNGYNGAFQYTYGRHNSWIHRDHTDFSAIIYLTPDPPPDGGTLTYRHKTLKIERDSEAKSKEEIDEMNEDSNNEDKWDRMDVIANKYNRLIIFSGRRSHRSNKYFGSSRQNGRLFQTFFFNVKGYA